MRRVPDCASFASDMTGMRCGVRCVTDPAKGRPCPSERASVLRIAAHKGAIRWFGVLEGTLTIEAGAWRCKLACDSWILCDGAAAITLLPAGDCRFVRGHYPASLLRRFRGKPPPGSTACLDECLQCPKRSLPELTRGSMDAAMRYAAFRLSEIRPGRTTSDLIAQGLLLEILGMVLQAREDGATVAGCPRVGGDLCCIEAAARFLQGRPEERHSIRSVARAAGSNEFKIKKGFRKVYNTTVFGYLRKVRMEQARRLFERGESNVASVAVAVGYSNPSHFARAFRRQFGINPKSFVLRPERPRRRLENSGTEP